MTAQANIEYFLQREAEARIAYATASHSKARDAHLDMAERYADLASMAAELEHDAAKQRQVETK